ncbi:MAG: biotin--[acetyl-CoA-carboxylase] ligase [Candidatus Margulisbacteria bacterium]|nr:biotin--[acetyl-CoA-carboxylase] ligase [Candidatus Margulisiibacteriota bacterium]
MLYAFYPELTSTNDEAKRLYQSGVGLPVCLVSECQVKGRGSHGRSWYSDGPEGLYYSLLLRPTFFSHGRTAQYVYRSAFLVGQVIYQLTGLSVTIKRPNDLLVSGKKVCGILLETGIGSGSERPDYVIIGVGLNLNQSFFPDDISQLATSLRLVSGQQYSKDLFISALTRELGYVFERD